MIEEFQDPLTNYEPREFKDPVEQALAEEPVTSIHHLPFTTITPSTTVEQAVETLAELKVSCLMVEAEGSLVGVFSERDVLLGASTDYEAQKMLPVSDIMTANPVYVHSTDASASALSVMAVSGFRHVPIIALDGKIEGIVSPLRVTEFLSSIIERH